MPSEVQAKFKRSWNSALRRSGSKRPNHGAQGHCKGGEAKATVRRALQRRGSKDDGAHGHCKGGEAKATVRPAGPCTRGVLDSHRNGAVTSISAAASDKAWPERPCFSGASTIHSPRPGPRDWASVPAQAKANACVATARTRDATAHTHTHTQTSTQPLNDSPAILMCCTVLGVHSVNALLLRYCTTVTV